MIIGPFLLLAIAAAQPPPPRVEQPLAEAAHAIAVQRYDQARALIATAVANGSGGEAVDRLLADLAFGSGDDVRALAGYQLLLARRQDETLLAERAGIAALRLGQTKLAVDLLDRATASPAAGWRAWNARGVAADRLGDWNAADRCYRQAVRLAPDSAEVANNRGWSLLLRGRWAEARRELARAVAIAPGVARIAANLELAGFALDDQLPERLPGERDGSWAARLNDAGVIARLTGDRQRAIAAFARALELRSNWFARAANNLAAIEGG